MAGTISPVGLLGKDGRCRAGARSDQNATSLAARHMHDATVGLRPGYLMQIIKAKHTHQSLKGARTKK